MANVKVIGRAVVITSTLKLADIELVEQYRPEALVLKEENEGVKEEVFRIGTTCGAGNIGTYGASFGDESSDGQGFAQITELYDPCGEDPKEFLADAIGGALMNLGKLEAALPAVISDIATQKAAVMAAITVE